MGEDQRSRHIKAHGELILSLCEATLELRAARGSEAFFYGGLWRFFDRHGITVKKVGACG
jgi:hypothetical protein